ncbi:COG1470 family protein [Nocardioides sp. B-3]|uniref:COG1470 family protein n=1 Tax=Nocardioides sp. B-3 TaxID=2895565 RepID=UPI002152C98A|nr:hypothetical protein [Nocardioides sp. B-3]UUZ61369.1 hypothetical protein LP418_12790 [Nocardioides sp. B-3]
MLTHTHRPTARPLPTSLPAAVRTALITSLLMAVALLAPASATAAPMEPGRDKASRAVRPGGEDGGSERSQFVYTLRPGSVLRDYINVINTGRKPVMLDLYTVDAFNVPEDGGFALRMPEEARTGVGGWVRLGKKSRIRLQPRKGLRIPFEISVPENAQPGDHAGAIVAANARLESGNKKGDLTFDVRRRVGVRIYLRVEGALEPGLSVSNFEAAGSAPLIPYVTGDGKVAVDWEITNTGNVRLDPSATVELVGPLGDVVKGIDVAVPELLPGGVLTGTSEFDVLPPYGKLSARMVVEAEDAEDTVSQTLWSVPRLPLLVLALLLSARWLRRRRRTHRWPFRSRAAASVISETEPEPAAVS